MLNSSALHHPLDPSPSHQLSSTQCYRPASQHALFPLEFWIAKPRTSLLGGIFSVFPFRSFVNKKVFFLASFLQSRSDQKLEIDMVSCYRIGGWTDGDWGDNGWVEQLDGFWFEHLVRFGEPFICSSLRHVWHNSEI
jgi:hypothetical protein